jgi:hypothetical protein
MARAMRGVTQLRLQARDRSTRSGLAGQSSACKRGFGLALPRADGEHHRARGGVASNRARDAVIHASRGGSRTAVTGRLDQGCYWGKRERERERCVSAADASTYGTETARGDPWHVCPQLTHAKTTPHVLIRPSPLKSLTSAQTGPWDRPKPDLSCPDIPPREVMNTTEHNAKQPACQERTADATHTTPTTHHTPAILEPRGK